MEMTYMRDNPKTLNRSGVYSYNMVSSPKHEQPNKPSLCKHVCEHALQISFGERCGKRSTLFPTVL